MKIDIINILSTAFGLAKQLATLLTTDAVIVFRPGTAGQQVNLATMGTISAFVHSQMIREGTIACTAGSNIITFTIGGIATPLASANHSTMEKGRNGLGNVDTWITSKTANGFIVKCALDCTLDYHSILNQ